MSMGTQYRFTLEDTNRDGAPVPDVFVVKDVEQYEQPLDANSFYDHLRRTSKDFHDVVTGVAEANVYRGREEGKLAVYKEIVEWWNDNDRNPNATVSELIREWDLSTQRTFTVTVSFEDVNQPLIVTGVDAEDEDEAKQVVLDGIAATWELDYSGPGDVDEDPFGDSTIYIDGVEAWEEED